MTQLEQKGWRTHTCHESCLLCTLFVRIAVSRVSIPRTRSVPWNRLFPAFLAVTRKDQDQPGIRGTALFSLAFQSLGIVRGNCEAPRKWVKANRRTRFWGCEIRRVVRVIWGSRPPLFVMINRNYRESSKRTYRNDIEDQTAVKCYVTIEITSPRFLRRFRDAGWANIAAHLAVRRSLPVRVPVTGPRDINLVF